MRPPRRRLDIPASEVAAPCRQGRPGVGPPLDPRSGGLTAPTLPTAKAWHSVTHSHRAHTVRTDICSPHASVTAGLPLDYRSGERRVMPLSPATPVCSQANSPPIHRQDQIRSFQGATVMVEASAHHAKGHRVHQEPQRVRLLGRQLNAAHLGRERNVPAALPAPPRRHQHRGPAARIQALHRLMPQGHPHLDTKPLRQFHRGRSRAGVGGLAGERPVGIRIREGAHSRRMRHIDGAPLLTFENALLPQEPVSEPHGLRVYVVLGRHLAS